MRKNVTKRNATPGRRNWVERLEPLKSAPGAWHLVATYGVCDANAAYSMSQALRDGRVRMPAGQWSATTRRETDRYGIYARFEGTHE